MPGPRIARAPRADPGGERDIEFLKRAAVRDVLAWMRLLVDPRDASAVVRALSRPPIDLRQVDLARVIALARRRKLDLVMGLGAAVESPQVPPEARDRIQRFADLHRAASAELEILAPAAFVAALIGRLTRPARGLLAPEHADAQRSSLEQLHEAAVELVRRNPAWGVRELTRNLTAAQRELQREGQAPAGEGSGDAPGVVAGEAEGSERGSLEEVLHLLREEVMLSVGRIGSRLGELRLDTDLDICHGVVRYLELLKLSALLQRGGGEGLAAAIDDINTRLLAAASPLQREIFETSTLDETLLGDSADEQARAHALAPRGEPSLVPFLPRKGAGLALSASDIQTYRSCPLRYKFARVLRIPAEQTLNQRFGIVVHQVLERYHSAGTGTGAGAGVGTGPGTPEGGGTGKGRGAAPLAEMLELLDACWSRAGLGGDGRDGELLEKARSALTRYHARLDRQRAEPVWFERQFDFRLGPHHLRGRVDRVDRLAGEHEEYELIDYKTSRPKSAEELADDVQLSLYALAAREAWQLDSVRLAYYYVLDDLKVEVPRGERDAAAVRDVVLEVGEGILAQQFEPTPSHAACSLCDYRIACPAAEV